MQIPIPGQGDLTFEPLMGEGFELSQPWVTSAPSEGLSAFRTGVVHRALHVALPRTAPKCLHGVAHALTESAAA